MKKLQYIITLLILILNIKSYAAIEPVNVRLQGSTELITGAELIVNDNKLWLIESANFQNSFSIQSVKNKIIFGIDESDISFNTGAAYSYEIKGDISYKVLENGELVEHFLTGINLDLNYNPSRGTTYKDRSVFSFTGGLQVKFQITEINDLLNGGGPVTSVPSFLFLESEIVTERYYPFDQSIVPLVPMQMNIDNGELSVSWPYIEGAEEYELEWIWVNRYTGELNQDGVTPQLAGASGVNYNFNENASRVRVHGYTTYNIPLIYGDGFIIVRYRGIGRGGEGFRVPLEGQWNFLNSTGVVSNTPNYIIVNAHEQNSINYGAGVSFIENGVRSVGVTYMDGVLKPRQSQAKLNSQDKIIVGSTVYDHYGRPAIGVMSTPVDQSTLGYVDNLNMHSDGTVYNKGHFDFDNTATTCGEYVSAPAMDASSSAGAANYYSDQNPDIEGYNAYLSDAAGYPFVQVKYSNDPTGRVKRVGGIGPDHQLGKTFEGQLNQNEAHYTEYFYDTPDDLELYKLFGNEGNSSNNYTRVITKDVHGQLSVAITDVMGRTVATYMMGPNPIGLSRIEGNDLLLSPASKDFMMYNTTDEIEGIIEVNTPLFVSDSGEPYEFNYDFTGVSFESCLPADICFDCAYTIKISIIPEELCELGEVPSIEGHITNLAGQVIDDENGEVHLSFEVGTIDATNFNIDCDTYTFSGVNSENETFTVVFPKLGNYQIIKKLIVSEAPIDYYWEQYVTNSTCLLTYEDFLATTLASIDPSACEEYEPCEYNFLIEHGTFEVYLTNHPGATQLEYDELRQSYIDACSIQSSCDAMYPGMIADFKLGGQYALPSSSGDVTSLFNGLLTLGNISTYLPDVDVNGNPILVDVNGDGSPDTAPSALTSISQLEDGYQNEWAHYFIPLHPEYCFYDFCTTHADIYEFENTLNTTSTYAEACSLGLFSAYSLYSAIGCDAAGSASTDPVYAYFSTGTPSCTDMQTIITQPFSYEGVDYDIFQMAAVLSGANAGDFGNVALCNVELHWQNFRSLYFSRRFQIIELLKTESCSNITTDCIQDPACVTIPYGGKVARYIDFETGLGFDLDSNPNWGELAGDGSATIDASCLSQCDAMADAWMDQLSGCVPDPLTWVTGNTLYDNVRQGLIDVCAGGCSPEWPFLAQNNPNAEAGEYTSFQDVIESLIGTETATCSHLLIFNPSPNAGSESLVQYLDDCACNTLLGTADLEEYIQIYGFSPINYSAEKCKCSEEYDLDNNNLIDGIEITNLATAEEFTPNYYPCSSVCIDCTTMPTWMNGFNSLYGINYFDDPLMFLSYVNEQTNGTYLYDELVELIENCQLDGGTPLPYTQEVYDLIPFLNALVDDNITTAQSYNHISLPELFYSSLYNCGNETVGVFDYQPVASSLSNYIYIPFMDENCKPCNIRIYQGSNMGDYSTFYNLSQNIVSFNEIVSSGNTSFDINVVVNYASGVGTFITVLSVNSRECYSVSNNNPTPEFEICSDDPELPDEVDCMDELITNAQLSAETLYGEYLYEQEAIFRQDYITSCTQITDETFTADYANNKYQYTLLYYDQSGSLVKTVPPKGVAAGMLNQSQAMAAKQHFVTDGVSGPAIFPNYSYETTYKHNSLNQVVMVNTPDGGTSNYWYDAIGRLVVSQNARQAEFNTALINNDYANPTSGASIPAYSYTRYDVLGRVIEVGEIIQSTQMTKTLAKNPVQLENWLNQTTATTHNNVTRMNYDMDYSSDAEEAFGNGGYGNTRNRIVSTSVIEGYFTATAGQWNYPEADYINHYRYDIHGNVQSYLQEIKELANYNNKFRKVDYEYDLISGNPNYIYYQKGKKDQYIHKYIYDKDNRLKEVFTSSDNQIWDRDVNYEYREDGYLARTEIGEMKVQGMDYAYTLHGWLKTLNSGVLNADFDMGKDGEVNPSVEYSSLENDAHGLVAQDALAYTIGYYEGDYTAISSTTIGHNNMQLNTTGSAFETDKQDLFNGNITSLITNLTGIDGIKQNVNANTYHYDQLHRFKEMHVFSSSDITTNNNLSTAIRASIGTNGLGDYEVQVSYDMNGNISNLTRMAFTHQDDLATTDDDNDIFHDNKMDDFSYDYSVANLDGSLNNKLNFVTDGVNSTDDLGYGDIKHNQQTGNYTYHADGSLKSDIDEGIEYIAWYPSGKIKYIKRVAGSQASDLYFEYGPMGIRSLKVELIGGAADPTNWKQTYYATDANGITMAIYDLNTKPDILTLNKIESMIYGGSRLGMETSVVEMNEVYNPIDVCHTDGLQSTIIKIGPQTPTIGSSLNLILDNTILASVISVSSALGNAQMLVDDINLSHEGIRARVIDLNTIPASYYIEIKEVFAGGLSGVVSFEYFASGSTVSLSNSILRQPTIGECYSERVLGKKMYELSNHLGNVMEVITDRKILELSGQQLDLENLSIGGLCVNPGNSIFDEVAGTNYITTDVNGDGQIDLTVSHPNYHFSYQQNALFIPGETYTVNYDMLSHNINTKTFAIYRCDNGQHILNESSSALGMFSHSITIPLDPIDPTDLTPILVRLKWVGVNYGGDYGEFVLSNIQVHGEGDIFGVNNGIDLSYYAADVVSYSDYYPYGMQMSGRNGTISGGEYRYAFNGMETDKEVTGSAGNSYTTQFRQYDPRLGRWKSLDPLAGKYASLTPFSGMDNNPIALTDPLGLKPGGRLKKWIEKRKRVRSLRRKTKGGFFRRVGRGISNTGFTIGRSLKRAVSKIGRAFKSIGSSWGLPKSRLGGRHRPWGKFDFQIGPIRIVSRQGRHLTRRIFPFHIVIIPSFVRKINYNLPIAFSLGLRVGNIVLFDINIGGMNRRWEMYFPKRVLADGTRSNKSFQFFYKVTSGSTHIPSGYSHHHFFLVGKRWIKMCMEGRGVLAPAHGLPNNPFPPFSGIRYFIDWMLSHPPNRRYRLNIR